VGTYSGSLVLTDNALNGNPSTQTLSLSGTATQGTQTITFTPTSPVTYGVTPITLNATGGASGNPVTFSIVSGSAFGSLSGTNNSTLTVTGAGTIMIAANQAGNTNYFAATQVTAGITVNKATLTVGVSGTPSRFYGQPNPAFVYTIGTFVNGDTQLSATTGAPALTTTAAPKSAAGNYTITVGLGTLAAANYSFNLVNGQLTVNGGSAQVILFPALANFTHGTSVPLAALATSGLPVSFTVTNGPANITGGTTLNITGTGSVTVTASQAGNGNFGAATPVARTFTAQ
jgi:hypothetical protein